MKDSVEIISANLNQARGDAKEAMRILQNPANSTALAECDRRVVLSGLKAALLFADCDPDGERAIPSAIRFKERLALQEKHPYSCRLSVQRALADKQQNLDMLVSDAESAVRRAGQDEKPHALILYAKCLLRRMNSSTGEDKLTDLATALDIVERSYVSCVYKEHIAYIRYVLSLSLDVKRLEKFVDLCLAENPLDPVQNLHKGLCLYAQGEIGSAEDCLFRCSDTEYFREKNIVRRVGDNRTRTPYGPGEELASQYVGEHLKISIK